MQTFDLKFYQTAILKSASGHALARHSSAADAEEKSLSVDISSCLTRCVLLIILLQGYNAAIIAYGQTGTGKTFTMEGERDGPQRGIIPRAVEDIFTCIESDTATGSKYLVRASYLQIYNEVCRSAGSTQVHARKPWSVTQGHGCSDGYQPQVSCLEEALSKDIDMACRSSQTFSSQSGLT